MEIQVQTVPSPPHLLLGRSPAASERADQLAVSSSRFMIRAAGELGPAGVSQGKFTLGLGHSQGLQTYHLPHHAGAAGVIPLRFSSSQRQSAGAELVRLEHLEKSLAMRLKGSVQKKHC